MKKEKIHKISKMNMGKFRISLNYSAKLLKDNNLLKYHNDRYSLLSNKISIKIFKKENIIDIYKLIVNNFDFDILLKDESVIKFEIYKIEDKLNLKYTFCQFPYDFPSYKEYLIKNGYNYDEVGEIFKEDYEQELSEAKLKQAYIYIRYDYNPNSYMPVVHAASHIHFGNTTIRIPVSKIITPLSFTFFIMKHVYYKHWSDLMNNEKFFKEYLCIKKSCKPLENSGFFGEQDKKDLYLT